jgi:hypothetical protein
MLKGTHASLFHRPQPFPSNSFPSSALFVHRRVGSAWVDACHASCQFAVGTIANYGENQESVSDEQLSGAIGTETWPLSPVPASVPPHLEMP